MSNIVLSENFDKLQAKHITAEDLRFSEDLLEGLELLVTTPETFLLILLPGLCNVQIGYQGNC